MKGGALVTERTAQQHPIKLLSYTTRYFWLLIIPIVRSLYSLSLDANAFKTWLKGTWFDLIVVAAILVFAWLRLVSVTFTFDHEKIIVRRGIFVAAQDVVWYKEISTLSIKQGFLYRLVGASTVYIGTNAGIFDKADITLVMKRSDADRLYASVKGSRAKSLNYSISTNRLKLLIFSILSSSTLLGVIVALAFIVETWQVFDREVEARIILDTLSEFADRLSVIVPPIAAGISIIIAGSWLISFITNVFYFWGYVLTKCSDSLYLKSGLLSRNRHIIKLDRINYIDLKQSFLARMLRISSLHCQCSGYGSTGRSELSVVMPITSSREISGAISEVFPDYPSPRIELKPAPRSFMGFYFWPALLCVIPLAAYALINAMLPTWSSVAQTAMIIAEIPIVWLAVVKTLSVFTTGIGMSEGHIIMRYSKRYTFHTVIAPKDRITKVVLRQSAMQHISGNCTAIIYTSSDSKTRHHIYGLKLDRALSFFDRDEFDLFYRESTKDSFSKLFSKKA